jgi:hypothetical protein
MLRSGQPRVLAKTAKLLQNLRENIDAREIELSPEDVQAVRGHRSQADAAQGDRSPKAYI